MSRFDVEDGCITLPILLIIFIIKCALVLAVYGLAIMMFCASIFGLPLIIIVAIFKNDSEMIMLSLFGWFALAQEFKNRIFK